MTRYLLDGRSLQDESAVRGIGTYLRGLLDGFGSVGVTHDIALLLERGGRLPTSLAAAGFGTHPGRLRPLNRHLRPLIDPIQIRRAIGALIPDLYHAVEYGQPLFPSIPVVVTVHDLIPFVMAREYPWMRRERALPMRQFRRADAVIAVSRSTADDLERIAGVDPARISVIGEGVTPHRPRSEAELASMRHRLRLPDRFVLAVGTFDPRKRVAILADVVRRVRHHHDVGLVVAGSQGNFATTVEISLRNAGIATHTRLLGHVGQDDLGDLYQMCECLLFTSAYEGFGLPPLEAMAAGAPAAVFDNSSLREVVGDAGLVIADGDAGAMSDAVSRLLAEPGTRQRLSDQGRERAAAFSWEATAAATLRVYSHVLATR
ncbi:MAG: glycosyltransferase family 4 protein [Candidatus Dormibacteraeota bacterium]|nr:glycosyltransferase family 4 protein [Candidatus Dormibacteraeota bacterium]